ncbi:hypothetical protein LCGC14_2536840 [marine sediment metagenome]|uniref:Uncharacterized protein n=1 Tax=marine sediment metagenome TaxID=412755 RepID=A0A0F9ASB9_9ZZZZ
MSKKLTKAIAEGRVAVRNTTSGEVVVIIRTDDGVRNVLIAPFATKELAPRLTDAVLLKRSPNLAQLLRGPLRVA